MSTPAMISDAALEAMLARRAYRADPDGLRDEAFALIDAVEPRRSWLGWRTGFLLGRWPVRQAALITAAAALLLAAVAGALVGARLLDTTPRTPLVPTGIDVLVSVPGSYTHLVADGEGIAWLREDTGAIVRFDPATRSRRSWSVADDAAFSATNIVAARAGGVWLVGPDALRRFDGTGIREVIETPTEIADVAEVPRGGLWALTSGGDTLHWDGSTWTRLEVSRPSSKPTATDARAIAVDAEGKPWIGWGSLPTSEGWLAHYDGTTWTTFTERTAAPLGYSVRAIAPVPGGALWVATEGGLARFDGAAWTDETARLMAALKTDDLNVLSVAVGSDGGVWALAANWDTGIAVGRFDGRTWVQEEGEADGLLETGLAIAVPTKDGTLVGVTGDASAIHVLVDGRWEQHPSQGSGPKVEEGRPVLAVSRDELLAIGRDGGVWHFNNGAWTLGAIDPEHPGGKVQDLALAPDGTPWAAGEDGVAYWRDGRWVVIDTEPANVVTVDRDGTAWVNRTGSAQGIGQISCDLWTLRSNGTKWAPTPIQACPRNLTAGPGWVNGIAVDGRGALWVEAERWGPDGLARWAEGRWEAIDASDGLPRNNGVEVLGISAAGDVWIGLPQLDGGTLYARFDGTEWKVAEPPGGLALAPDGTLWAATDRGPARYEGQQWTFPYPPVSSPGQIAVAPDGTVFAHDGMAASIWRFPAAAP